MKSYKEIYEKLQPISKKHYYMSDEDKFGQLDIYEWNDNKFEIIDKEIHINDKQIYQDCESFSIRCLNALIEIYGDSIKEELNLKLMIGTWNGIGHGFFTFTALDDDKVLREFLWDNNLPCPLPLDIMLLSCNYKITNIFSLHKKKFYKVTIDPLVSMTYNGISGTLILETEKNRIKG